MGSVPVEYSEFSLSHARNILNISPFLCDRYLLCASVEKEVTTQLNCSNCYTREIHSNECHTQTSVAPELDLYHSCLGIQSRWEKGESILTGRRIGRTPPFCHHLKFSLPELCRCCCCCCCCCCCFLMFFQSLTKRTKPCGNEKRHPGKQRNTLRRIMVLF